MILIAWNKKFLSIKLCRHILKVSYKYSYKNRQNRSLNIKKYGLIKWINRTSKKRKN